MRNFGEHRKSLVEADKKPYRLVILSHDDPEDPNETGDLIRETAKKLSIKCILGEFVGAYISQKGGGLYLNTFPVEKGGAVAQPNPKVDEMKYDKPFKLDADDTIIMARGLAVSGLSGNHSWSDMIKDLDHRGFTIVNTNECHQICSDKVMNQIVFERHKFNTPKTVRVTHSEGYLQALKELNSKFPIILKTGTGSRGVGVILVESAASLQSIVQLLYRENEYIDIILQEQIVTDYDVRVIVCVGEVVGVMKRPIIAGDFRSNVSLGSKAVTHELTELEAKESIEVAKAVGGTLVGVDFIPAKDREKDRPYFIEVNSTPGLIGIEDTTDDSIVENILNKLREIK